MYNKRVAFADVTQWQSVRFPSRIRGFDSRHLLQRSRASPKGMRGFFCNQYRIRTLSAARRKRMCVRTTCRLAPLLPHISVLIPVICPKGMRGFFCNQYRIRTLSAARRKRMCVRTTCRLAPLLPHISVLIPVICPKGMRGFFCNRYRIRTLPPHGGRECAIASAASRISRPANFFEKVLTNQKNVL